MDRELRISLACIEGSGTYCTQHEALSQNNYGDKNKNKTILETLFVERAALKNKVKWEFLSFVTH